MTKKISQARGRPQLPKKERQSVLMQFRVTESEAASIKRIANGSGLSVSSWLRQQATANAKK